MRGTLEWAQQRRTNSGKVRTLAGTPPLPPRVAARTPPPPLPSSRSCLPSLPPPPWAAPPPATRPRPSCASACVSLVSLCSCALNLSCCCVAAAAGVDGTAAARPAIPSCYTCRLCQQPATAATCCRRSNLLLPLRQPVPLMSSRCCCCCKGEGESRHKITATRKASTLASRSNHPQPRPATNYVTRAPPCRHPCMYNSP